MLTTGMYTESVSDDLTKYPFVPKIEKYDFYNEGRENI